MCGVQRKRLLKQRMCHRFCCALVFAIDPCYKGGYAHNVLGSQKNSHNCEICFNTRSIIQFALGAFEPSSSFQTQRVFYVKLV